MAGYSGTPLIKKIGIKPEHSLLFINAPDGYFSALGEIPYSKHLADTHADFVHAFYVSKDEFVHDADILAATVSKRGMLWVSWPKKSAHKILPSDLTEQDFRDVLLPKGFVDVKVCAVTDIWSGLKFVWRKDNR